MLRGPGERVCLVSPSPDDTTPAKVGDWLPLPCFLRPTLLGIGNTRWRSGWGKIHTAERGWSSAPSFVQSTPFPQNKQDTVSAAATETSATCSHAQPHRHHRTACPTGVGGWGGSCCETSACTWTCWSHREEGACEAFLGLVGVMFSIVSHRLPPFSG